MAVFLTVGTTKFDLLVQTVISPKFQKILSDQGYKSLTIQSGKSVFNKEDLRSGYLNVTQYDYKPSLTDDFKSSDLIISHAGSGTCFEVLELGKPLIVVVNEDLMDNHQKELAEKLHEESFLVHCVVSTLEETLKNFKKEKLKKFVNGDIGIFSNFVNNLFGIEKQD